MSVNLNPNYINQLLGQDDNAPNHTAMLKSYHAFTADLTKFENDLQLLPPDIEDAQRVLADMMQQAEALNFEAQGDVLVTPAIASLIGVLKDLQTLLNSSSPNPAACLTLIQSGYSDFQNDLGDIWMFIIHTANAPPPPSGTPNYEQMFQQFNLLEKYLAEFKTDIQDKNYSAADAIYGYVLTAANNLLADSNDNSVVTPIVAALLGNIHDIQALFNNGDYGSILQLMGPNSSLQQAMGETLSAILHGG